MWFHFQALSDRHIGSLTTPNMHTFSGKHETQPIRPKERTRSPTLSIGILGTLASDANEAPARSFHWQCLPLRLRGSDGAGSSTFECAASERSLAEQGGAEILTPEEAQLLLTAVGQPEGMQTHSSYQS